MDLLLEHFAYTKPNFNPNHQSELLGGKFKILFLTARSRGISFVHGNIIYLAQRVTDRIKMKV